MLPRARVIYSSATGASEPSNLAYMTRLGCWGFKNMADMIRTLGRCPLAGFLDPKSQHPEC